MLVHKFRDLGLFLSYDQMLVLSTQHVDSVYTQFESDGVICATKLCSNVFTTFAVYNIDHNARSRSTKASWDGTSNFSTKHL